MSIPKPYYENAAMKLYHGDALELLPKFEAGAFAMAFTDPPYGHNNNNGDLISNIERALGKKDTGRQNREPRPIPNDGAEATPLFEAFLVEAKKLRCCCCCCCGGGGGPDPQFARWSLILDKHFDFCQMVVWDKGPIGLGWHYRRSYETVLVGYAKGLKRKPFFDNSHKIENIIRPTDGIRKIIPSAADHPTPKPPELAARFIRCHSKPGDTIMDPFAGGGSTGIAAMRTGRKAVLIELEERFCELAAKRLEAESSTCSTRSTRPTN